jgi:hypothetical protein
MTATRETIVEYTDHIVKVGQRVDTVFVDIGGLRIQISRDGSDNAPEIGVYAYDAGATHCKAHAFFDAPNDDAVAVPDSRVDPLRADA